MASQQSFPQLDTPISDPDTGAVNLPWIRFFLSMWNRTGGAVGNNSSSFLYPATTGNNGQVLTSGGPTHITFWTTLASKLSQFVNDVGYITIDALSGLSTPTTVQTQINTSLSGSLSTQTPPADTTAGAAGSSTFVARADHSHPRERNPRYDTVGVGTATWTAGSGVPVNASQPNGSMYSRTDGTLGARLYVSDGVTWRAIAAV